MKENKTGNPYGNPLAHGAAAGLLILAGLLGTSQTTSAANGRFVNLSTRALVETGDEVMIGGFIIADGSQEVLVQALGPELTNRGITNALADPVLTVTRASDGMVLMVNDNWEDSQGQLVSDLWGGSPNLAAGSLSSAVVLTLEPGNYSAKVEGKNGTAGVAIIEVYGIDSRGSDSSDRSVLTALYDATDGPNWTKSANWGTDMPLNLWHGVKVDGYGRVIKLRLESNRLSGSIPANLGNLAYLEVLWLSNNQLSGPIPAELGNLAYLESLALYGNQLNGPIPAQLGQLANLEYLGLHVNQLSGPIPTELGNLSYLERLALYDNQLSGTIPAQLGQLANLERLWLHANQLGGPIPVELGNLANLEFLYLGDNLLSGCIPDELRDVENNDLSTMDLPYCGDFPDGSGPGNQSYTVGTAIPTLTLPKASGGDGTLTYSLTPSVPGLSFDANTRRLTGTPTTAGTYSMTYTVTDTDGDSDSLTFTISVQVSDDHGDERTSATRVELESDTEGVLERGDVDYFRIDVTTFGTLEAYTSGRTDTVGQLEDADGAVLRMEDDGGIGSTNWPNFWIWENVSPGTYYVRIAGKYRTITGGYTLHLRVVTPASPAPDQFPTLRSLLSRGIAYADGRLYVTDHFPFKVYVYGADGKRISSADFNLDMDNRSPNGITYADDKLFVVDSVGEKVFAYGTDGSRDASSDFDLPSYSYPQGITNADGKLYILGNGPSGVGRRVYAYRTDGSRDASSDFDVLSGLVGGITNADGLFYIVKGGDERVYAYRTDGSRDPSSDFYLPVGSDRPYGITYGEGKIYVLHGKVYIFSAETAEDALDLGMGSVYVTEQGVYVTGPELAPNESFTLNAPVHNRSAQALPATTLRYYLSPDAAITPGDTEVGMNAVPALDASDTSSWSILLTAPSIAGTYYFGACVDAVSGESYTVNNCSRGIQVEVFDDAGEAADLVVESPSVSDDTLDAGASFTLNTTVRNKGKGRSRSTTLRYYLSSDSTIAMSDTEVGTDDVDALAASGTSDESIRLTAPSSAGTYYYGACVDSVLGESDTANNCSSAVAVTVGGGEPPPSDDYTPLERWWVYSNGLVNFVALTIGPGNCVNVNGSTLNGVTYVVHSSKWQRRANASSSWEDVSGTEQQGKVCSYVPTTSGEYRMVGDITVGTTRGNYSSENTATIN